MKNFLITFLILIIVVGCTSNTIYKKPKDLIPKAKMEQILTDIYLANAASYLKNNHLQRDMNYMSLVYQKYHIDSVRFSHSNFYYMSKIDVYEEMHQHILENIKKWKEEKSPKLEQIDTLHHKILPKTNP